MTASAAKNERINLRLKQSARLGGARSTRSFQMSSASSLAIELPTRNHDRTVFKCGIQSLDRYLQRQASQDMKRCISRVFVAGCLHWTTGPRPFCAGYGSWPDAFGRRHQTNLGG